MQEIIVPLVLLAFSQAVALYAYDHSNLVLCNLHNVDPKH